jgi:hypothetical protein
MTSSSLLLHEFGFFVFSEELEGTGELRVSGFMSDILVRRLESYSDRVERPPLTYSDIP